LRLRGEGQGQGDESNHRYGKSGVVVTASQRRAALGGTDECVRPYVCLYFPPL